MISKLKKYSKYVIGVGAAAFLTVAALTSNTVDDMVGKYVSAQTGVTVVVSPTEVLK